MARPHPPGKENTPPRNALLLVIALRSSKKDCTSACVCCQLILYSTANGNTGTRRCGHGKADRCYCICSKTVTTNNCSHCHGDHDHHVYGMEKTDMRTYLNGEQLPTCDRCGKRLDMYGAYTSPEKQGEDLCLECFDKAIDTEAETQPPAGTTIICSRTTENEARGKYNLPIEAALWMPDNAMFARDKNGNVVAMSIGDVWYRTATEIGNSIIDEMRRLRNGTDTSKP